jgi:hypothetical protein
MLLSQASPSAASLSRASNCNKARCFMTSLRIKQSIFANTRRESPLRDASPRSGIVGASAASSASNGDETPSTPSTPSTSSRQQQHHDNHARLLFTAKRFYEHAWSLPNPSEADLEPYLSEGHVQRDLVWQAGRESVGRGAMAKGMRHMRRAVYPDLSFTVEKAAVVDDESKSATTSVFVEWVFRGTFEGRADIARGVTVFDFEGGGERGSGKIARSSVYRQALPAEVDLARRTKKGEVAEGVLLEKEGK